MPSNNRNIKEIVSGLPDKPGVYQFFDKDNHLIYIGKAKSLKKRVSSYFNSEHNDNGKVRVMVKKIVDLKYIIVDSESDALLLENNLIKKYKPRYNILLKDDKTFPWIIIKNENFPRVYYTRNYVQDGSQYYGPYTSGLMVKTLLGLIKQLYPLRNCSLDLSCEKIREKKYKACLEFQIGNCKAPCISKQSLDDYMENISQIKDILKGNINDLIQHLKKLMNVYSQNLDFENANLIKQKIEIISNFQSKSTIVNSSISNVDVFSFIEFGNLFYINFIRILNGSIVQVHSIEIKQLMDESKEEILGMAIAEIRQKMLSTSKEIIVPFLPDIQLDNVKYTIPKAGDKLKLLELSERNAKYYSLEREKVYGNLKEKWENKKDSVLVKMKEDLRLKDLPAHIECFDNSNIQGTNPVAACVVFKNAKPAKNDYRHFNVKTVVGPDDFASMREIVFRRYRRMLDEGASLPNLIVIDGGKGQLGAALESLEKLDLVGKIPIIGIAKKLEEIYYPHDPIPIYIDKNSVTLKIIQQIRDEAHRFGITFHRQKRSNSMTVSVLDEINGLGDKSKEALYQKFKTLGAIKSATLDELAEVVGNAKAKILLEAFKEKSEEV